MRIVSHAERLHRDVWRRDPITKASVHRRGRREERRVQIAISLVLVGAKRAQALNATLRQKTYTPNVLSYRVGRKSGEIILCLSIAAAQAQKYKLSVNQYVLLLFIHACLHLKGGVHGVTMEQRERTLLAEFALPDSRNGSLGDRKNASRAKVTARASHTHVSKNRHRNRYWHVPGQNGRRRRGRG